MSVITSFLATLGVQPNRQSFQQANAMLDGLTSNAGKIAGVLGAAFAGHEILSWGKQLVARGDELNDLIAKTGLSGQALQSLGHAADQNGSSLEAVTNGLTRLSIQSQQAADGSKSAAANFSKLGISASELKKGLPTEEILGRIADKIAATQDPAKKTALAFAAFGKQGAALIPFLNNGRDGLAELQEEFRKLGGGLSDQFIAQADAINDELAKLHVTTTSLGSTLGVMLLPGITAVVRKMTEWSISIRGLLQGSQFLESALYVGTAAFVAWGIASLWASKAARSKLGLLGAMALLAAAVDEVSTALRGGKTLVGSWIDKWSGLGTVDSLVRSIGQGLKIIYGDFKIFAHPIDTLKGVVSDLDEVVFGTGARLRRINDLKKEVAAETNPNKKQVLVNQLVNELNISRDRAAHQLGETPRATGRGLDAAAETILSGRASASAVNEGAASTLFGMDGKAVQSASGKVQIVDSKVVQLGEINITAKTDASPREIGRHVRRAVRSALDSEADDIQRSRGRRAEADDTGDIDGDASLEGLDE